MRFFSPFAIQPGKHNQRIQSAVRKRREFPDKLENYDENGRAKFADTWPGGTISEAVRLLPSRT